MFSTSCGVAPRCGAAGAASPSATAAASGATPFHSFQPVAVANLVGEHVQDTELMMAGAVLTVLPVVALFVALQRYYIEGILSGSLKG